MSVRNVLLGMLLLLVFTACVPPASSKVWMEVDPKQCLTNPWEQAWLSEPGREYGGYPRGNVVEVEAEEARIITEYYELQGVRILEVDSVTFEEKAGSPVMVCDACSCPEGYTLYVLVKSEDVDRMEGFGFKVSERE